MPELPDLWGRNEIADALGVSVKSVDAWRRRDDFPAAAYELSHGPIWWADEVREWRRSTVAKRREHA